MQVNAIRKAKDKGHTVIVSDYLSNPPGSQWADYFEQVSTFDIEANIEVARKYEVDRVFTIGTDQPVYTAACVAEACQLPHIVTEWSALRATNKKFMKQVFDNNNIPGSKYRLLDRSDLNNWTELYKKLSTLQFPVVVKPLDSQGQRGIYKIPVLKPNIVEFMNDTFSYTRCDEIIVEEFFTGDEITVSAWVHGDEFKILMVTDRPLINIEPHLGTPDGHIYPSIYWSSHKNVIEEIIKQIIVAFRITGGPLYVQMMINQNSVQVVEIALRIGGGHEEELIPLVTGLDALELFIEEISNNDLDFSTVPLIDPENITRSAMVKFIVAEPGIVSFCKELSSVKAMPGVINAGFYNPNMEKIEELINSTRRIGYLIVEGETAQDVQDKVRSAYRQIEIIDNRGKNLVVDTAKHNSYYHTY